MKDKTLAPVPRTAEGLRDALFDEINLLRAGKGNLARARALSQLARQVIDSLRVQVQFQRELKRGKESPAILIGSRE